MFKRAALFMVVASMAAACGFVGVDGGSEELPQEWWEFDPCSLVDEELVVSVFDSDHVEMEAKSLTSLGGDEITNRHCSIEASGFRGVGVKFGVGSRSITNGEGYLFRPLPDIGDEAGMSVFLDGPDEGLIISIEANVEGMWLYVNSTPNLDIAPDTPDGGTLVALTRTAADRLGAAARAMDE